MNTKTKSLFGYIFPALGGLFVTYLYNVVDGIFVGQGVGSAALGAVNIGVPFITFVVAAAAMFPMGGAFTWAVFPCKGALPTSLQDVNTKIFSEWLPALQDYEFAAGYCIEMYDAPNKYPNGTSDENYYTEIWIPVKKK